MNGENWRNNLDDLGRALSERPPIRDRVMQQLETEIAGSSIQPANRRSRWYKSAPRALALSASAAILMLAVFVVSGLPSSPAFARVQDALRKIKTAVITRKFPESELSQRLLVSRRHDLYRVEWSNDAVLIQSRTGRTLCLNTRDKLASTIAGGGFGLEGESLAPGDFLDGLEDVEAKAVHSLGKKRVDGRELLGFELPADRGTIRRVWVDPDTYLPVLEKQDLETPLETIRSAGSVMPRPLRSTASYEFNAELSDELFSLEPPAGYKLVDVSDFVWPGHELAETPDDIDPANYVLFPGQGIGSAHFGMSKAEVIDALGRPDEVTLLGDASASEKEARRQIEQKAKEENWDRFRLQRELERQHRMRQPYIASSDVLRYYSLGFHVIVRRDTGLQEIMCWPKSSAYREFIGKTDLGISMASLPPDVRRVYGEATETVEGESGLSLYYGRLNFGFSFDENGAMQTMRFSRPKIDSDSPAAKQ